MFASTSVQSQRILYTPSPFAKSTLLYLQETGTLTALKAHTSARSNLSSFLFFIVLDGQGSLHYNGKVYRLAAGDCAFIDCRASYSHSTSDSLWKLQWAHFNSHAMPEIYKKYVARGGQPVLHPKDTAAYCALLDRLFHIASSTDYIRDMRLNETLSALLTQIMEASYHPEKRPEQKRGSIPKNSLQDVKDYLDAHWDQKIVLDDLANEFFINKFYLTRLFKQQYGVSIINYLLERRITQAKGLLRFTNQTVEFIGAACGFDDANYFSRAFKNIEGVSPTEYRKRWGP